MPVVVIPWRDTGCRHRIRALGWTVRQHMRSRPDWPVWVSTADDESGPWCKADAVMPAVAAAPDRDIVIVADADVWCDNLTQAVDAVENGAAWAIPHRLVWRYDQDATARIIAGSSPDGLPVTQWPYEGYEGGGFVVARRETLLDIPMPRFDGWGGEDESWAMALRTLTGFAPWRGNANLIHLWHPPQPRLSRRWGSATSRTLVRRFKRARNNPEQMRQLLAETAPVVDTV